MPLESYPIIKLEIDQMKYSIMHHFSAYQGELSKLVETEIERAIKGFDIESAVTDAVYSVIKESIDSYFSFGDGRKILNDAIKESLNVSLINLFKPKYCGVAANE